MGNYKREGYHTKRVAWRSNLHFPVGKRVGIELELEHSKGYKRLLELLPDTRGTKPLTERDGSLTELGGLEIVFPPYTYDGIRRKNSYFRKAINQFLTDPPSVTTNTGMHMNINTTNWPVDVKKMFLAFLHSMPRNQIINLGGRAPNHYCKVRYVSWRNMLSCVKHDLAWAKPNRIEVRFPAATLDIDKILNLVTLFDLVERFVRKNGMANWFDVKQANVRFVGPDSLWFEAVPKPAGFNEMSKAMWKEFKEFVDAQRKTEHIKAFLEAIG